ncbi:Probable adenosine monophosphate-protein transferase fic [Comamonas aquatica]|uniref:Fic/DOC family protein n=1 Tax=Comamonas aquatica TaxID=225991 RepID=UPI001EF28EB1|nr:Fic family protein [Comamonas aquatica]CAB5693667.1 Probable adenosine monophosphate-protein transferase fic [Comamonas aquatica]CAC9212965.1 Probable adenosine monophosphate-protein transferase fic [Comamonas aquatica]
MTDRYAVHGTQGEFQPGSNDLVLANKLGIQSVEDMNDLELELLQRLYEEVLVKHLPNRVLTVEDLKTWHRRWLGNVFEWAGQERSVNMGKDGFMFAASAQIPRLLADFERSCLARWTPCHDMDTDALVDAIAITHVEFILIHPFREGNGRLSRLLADVMAVQSGRLPLDYSTWNTDRPAYYQAIHQGLQMEYAPMKWLVAQALSGAAA